MPLLLTSFTKCNLPHSSNLASGGKQVLLVSQSYPVIWVGTLHGNLLKPNFTYLMAEIKNQHFFNNEAYNLDKFLEISSHLR